MHTCLQTQNGRQHRTNLGARKRQYVECDLCNEQIQARSLPRHKRSKHGIDTAAITAQTTPPHLSEHGNTFEISMPEYKQHGCPMLRGAKGVQTISLLSCCCSHSV
jgi:hypothetical protein